MRKVGRNSNHESGSQSEGHRGRSRSRAAMPSGRGEVGAEGAWSSCPHLRSVSDKGSRNDE